MEGPTVFRTTIRVVYSVMGICIGLSVFLVFGLKYENWNAALWGLFSGVAALLTFTVHIFYIRGVWETHYGNLKHPMLLGCFIQLAGVCGFVVYIVLAIVQKQGLVVEGAGFYLTTIWCFMTWKWGFLLFFVSRWYRILYQAQTGLLAEKIQSA